MFRNMAVLRKVCPSVKKKDILSFHLFYTFKILFRRLRQNQFDLVLISPLANIRFTLCRNLFAINGRKLSVCLVA